MIYKYLDPYCLLHQIVKIDSVEYSYFESFDIRFLFKGLEVYTKLKRYTTPSLSLSYAVLYSSVVVQMYHLSNIFWLRKK